MKFEAYSHDTVAELLDFIAQHEEFESVRSIRNVTSDDIQAILREIAGQLREEAKNSPIMRKSQIRQQDLTYKTNQVISKLTPQEEEILFKSFKIS